MVSFLEMGKADLRTYRGNRSDGAGRYNLFVSKALPKLCTMRLVEKLKPFDHPDWIVETTSMRWPTSKRATLACLRRKSYSRLPQRDHETQGESDANVESVVAFHEAEWMLSGRRAPEHADQNKEFALH
jgi:hypothetical protein